MTKTQGQFQIQRNNKSGTFSAVATYIPNGDKVTVEDWTHDEYGIIPNGTECRTLTISEARAEYRLRKSTGWQ